jgi:hypothetical protein
MSDNSLADRDESAVLEDCLKEFFLRSLAQTGAEPGDWTIPFFTTSFADGTPFCDGNPVFSAANENKKVLLRVVLDDQAAEPFEYDDHWNGRYAERVVVGRVADLDAIKDRMISWLATAGQT